MSIDLLGQGLLVGINMAAFYALLSLGLALIFGILGVVNLAHGVLFMLGALGMFYIHNRLGLNFYFAILITIVILGLIGLLVEKILYRPINGEFAPFIAITLGITMILESLGYLVFGTLAKGVPAPIAGVSSFLGVKIANYRLASTIFTALLIACLYYLVHRTRLGRRVRAVEEDRVAAALQGINVHRINALVFCISVALAGAAGCVTAPLFGILPSMGSMPLLKAFMVIVLGGMGSMTGTILGAILIGIVDTFLGLTLGADIAYILTWVMIIFVLIFRPRGLFGH
jgi:branched-chain amino acid transport system permease protein